MRRGRKRKLESREGKENKNVFDKEKKAREKTLESGNNSNHSCDWVCAREHWAVQGKMYTTEMQIFEMWMKKKKIVCANMVRAYWDDDDGENVHTEKKIPAKLNNNNEKTSK